MSVQRIVSLLAAGTEILYALGLGDRVVGVSHECDFPEQVRAKPRVTKTLVIAAAPSATIDVQVRNASAAGEPLYRIDVDKLQELRPELIVTQAQCDVCAVDVNDVMRLVEGDAELRDAKVVALNPTTLEGIFQDILVVARQAGVPAEGRQLVDHLRTRVESIRSQSSRADDRPRVVTLEWIDPPMVAANWMPELVAIAGGRCDLTTPGAKSAYTRWEDVRAFDPEVVVVMPCGFDLPRAVSESRILTRYPGWHDLTAVRDRRVFAVDGNAYFNRSGPRIVDSLEILARLIHREIFPAPVDFHLRQAYMPLS